MAALRTRRVIEAPPARVWAVLAAFDRLAHWAAGIDHASYLTTQAEGVGTTRRVQVKRTTLVETVTEWEPEEALAYDIAGLPPFLPAVSNRWSLAPAGDGTEVTLTTTVGSAERGPAGAVQRLLAIPFGRASTMLVDGLAAEAERQPS